MQGSVAQNRAVEEDIVALQILSPSSWFISSALVKTATDGASALHPSASTPAALGDGALELPDEGSPETPASAAEGCSAVALEEPAEGQGIEAPSVPDEPTTGATPVASCTGKRLPLYGFIQRRLSARRYCLRISRRGVGLSQSPKLCSRWSETTGRLLDGCCGWHTIMQGEVL